MLDDILHDQATILRALADELDSVANVIERDRAAPPPGIKVVDPVQLNHHPVDVRYNCNSGPDSRIDLEASIRMARKDAREGRVVELDFGGKGKIILDSTNWDREVPYP
jgi:hypothetical protein